MFCIYSHSCVYIYYGSVRERVLVIAVHFMYENSRGFTSKGLVGPFGHDWKVAEKAHWTLWTWNPSLNRCKCWHFGCEIVPCQCMSCGQDVQPSGPGGFFSPPQQCALNKRGWLDKVRETSPLCESWWPCSFITQPSREKEIKCPNYTGKKNV